MAGSKKNKQKKAAAAALPPPPPPVDDDDLMDDLLAQLDERESSTTQPVEAPAAMTVDDDENGSNPRKDSKSRFKARQARKAAALEQTYITGDPAEDARLEAEARQEQTNIDRICSELGVQLNEVNPDGHCLFSSVADQLEYLGILPGSKANYAVVRQTASQYILTHPDDFLPFLPSPNGEDRLLTPEEFEKYCVTMRDTAEWGGEPEIQALSRAYNIPIHVIQGGRPPVMEHKPSPNYVSPSDKRVVRISYHRRMYGLGEVNGFTYPCRKATDKTAAQHYNSLRPKSTLSNLSQKMHNILSTS